jgi:predicted protein tyrosine phosphatase
MKIAVASRDVVEHLELPDVPHIIVSIRSPGERTAIIKTNAETRKVLQLCFLDLDRVVPGMEEQECDLFQPRQAQQILELVKAHPDAEYFIAHCEGGLSRSPGVAAAISKIVNGDDSAVFKRHSGLNRRVYRMILEEHFGKTAGETDNGDGNPRDQGR